MFVQAKGFGDLVDARGAERFEERMNGGRPRPSAPPHGLADSRYEGRVTAGENLFIRHRTNLVRNAGSGTADVGRLSGGDLTPRCLWCSGELGA